MFSFCLADTCIILFVNGHIYCIDFSTVTSVGEVFLTDFFFFLFFFLTDF